MPRARCSPCHSCSARTISTVPTWTVRTLDRYRRSSVARIRRRALRPSQSTSARARVAANAHAALGQRTLPSRSWRNLSDGLGNSSPVDLGQDRTPDAFQLGVGIHHRKEPAAAGDHLAAQRCLLDRERLGREGSIRGQCRDPAGDLAGTPLRREGGDAADPEEGDTVQHDRRGDLLQRAPRQRPARPPPGPGPTCSRPLAERELNEAEERYTV